MVLILSPIYENVTCLPSELPICLLRSDPVYVHCMDIAPWVSQCFHVSPGWGVEALHSGLPSQRCLPWWFDWVVSPIWPRSWAFSPQLVALLGNFWNFGDGGLLGKMHHWGGLWGLKSQPASSSLYFLYADEKVTSQLPTPATELPPCLPHLDGLNLSETISQMNPFLLKLLWPWDFLSQQQNSN